MRDTSREIDQLLRQKLAGLPPEKPSGESWERLAAALEADGDLQIRQALTALEARRPASGWAELESKLDPRATADARLAGKLNGLTPVPPPGDWQTLSNKLDAGIADEVDAIVSGQLTQENNRTSGWAALAARLELISQRRHLIGSWKVTEVCLLASLMLLLLRFGPPPGPEQDAGNQPAAVVAQRLQTETAVPSAVAQEKETPVSSVSPATTTVRTSPAVPQAAVDNADRSASMMAISALPVPRYRVEGMTLTERRRPVLVSAMEAPAYIAEWAATLPSPALELPAIDKSTPVRYYLNAFVSPAEANEVITPSSGVRHRDLGVRGRHAYSHSMSAGLLLDVSKGRDGLQVGAIYTRHAYTPAELLSRDCFTSGECPDGFTRFEYHSLSFPFAYERSLLQRNDWRIGMRAGMSMSIITRSDYEEPENATVTIEDALNNARSPGLPPPTFISVNDLVNPEPGWFEGGSLYNNASFYLTGGFTVERYLSARSSLYLSPFYGRVIYLRNGQGVGPYNDRINRMGVRVGTRYLLGGR